MMTSLIGPNGAGKSTALALAAGLLAPGFGEIRLNNKSIHPKSPPASTGYLPQNSTFHPLLRVEEVLELTIAARQVGLEAQRKALEVTGLSDVLDRPVGELSGGWVRRLGLMTALAGAPDLLLLDEPFIGLDPETHDRVMAHLRGRIDSGAIVVVASHDFEALDQLTPKVAVLDEGRLRTTTLPGSGPSRSLYRQALQPTEAPNEDGA